MNTVIEEIVYEDLTTYDAQERGPKIYGEDTTEECPQTAHTGEPSENGFFPGIRNCDPLRRIVLQKDSKGGGIERPRDERRGSCSRVRKNVDHPCDHDGIQLL